jgi:hypothetical protein
MKRAFVAATTALMLWGAQANACRLALVLALDVSSSVDVIEDRLQRNGLASALLAPEVQAAFFATPDPVALYAFEWSGRYDQSVLVSWQMIRTPADLVSVAETLVASTRSRSDMPTALGHALGHAAVALTEAPACLFQTIDVAGDGFNNEGFGPSEAYAHFPFDEVTVNALVIEDQGFAGRSELLEFFQNDVRRGPGSFVVSARGYSDYERAMRIKLERELRAIMIGGLPGSAPQG